MLLMIDDKELPLSDGLIKCVGLCHQLSESLVSKSAAAAIGLLAQCYHLEQ